MQTILDQEAIDALFTAQAAGLPLPPANATAVERYNFGRAGQISNEQMRAISLVNDQFARNAMHTLGAWLRTQTEVKLVAGEQMPYGEFLARIPEPAYVCLLHLEPLGGMGLFEIELPLAFTMIDLLLGGAGRAGVTRELTDIEDMILVSVVDVMLRELNLAWQAVGLRFRKETCSDESKLSRLMPGAERTLCVSFEMDVLGVRGLLNFCLPAVVLNTIHRRLLAVSEKPREKTNAARERMTSLLAEASLPVTLRLPAVRLRSGELQRLQAGSLLELPLPRHRAAELHVGGVKLCDAAPVSRGGLRAAMLPELQYTGIPAEADAAVEGAAA